MRCLKNTILKGITWLNGISFVVFACALDSESWIPPIICLINMLWLMLFGYANGWFDEYEDY